MSRQPCWRSRRSLSGVYLRARTWSAALRDPCRHEHARTCCPALQLDPQQRPRPIEIIRNLRERITEARSNGWLGESARLMAELTSRTSAIACTAQQPSHL
ncbi:MULTISPECIES: hypothetical protein [Streptomyces]|uniref:Uncharacterized protein n=2 Tax=Streptomyces TaxID=1883 RepID=A0A3Q9G0T8_STRLT|nr:hypothetical protein [Streptomyces luteoverticillatus]AZQ75071.1 hypothetical protein EKH77_31440 [Streptomyces luteoverticillatus]